MLWLTIKEFCQATKMTEQGVYKKIKKGQLETKRDANTTLIRLDIPLEKVQALVIKEDIQLDKTHKDNIDFLSKLVGQYKLDHDNELERLKESQAHEIGVVKEYSKEIIKTKDISINDLKEEIDKLKEENEKLRKKRKKWFR